MTKESILEIQDKGFCVLKRHFAQSLVNTCGDGFWPTLLAYLEENREAPNRGPHRHFLPMPFDGAVFVPELFFDKQVLSIVCGAMDDRIAADQWGCDVPLRGSEYQLPHVDYQRPLFAEFPDMELPAYMLVVSFGLVPITLETGPIEIAAGTHWMDRNEAMRAVEGSEIEMQPVPLEMGDVLIRHPWCLHRGSPNRTDEPRPLVTIRYVRRWYADRSRDVASIPRAVWDSLEPEQQSLMRFPIGD